VKVVASRADQTGPISWKKASSSCMSQDTQGDFENEQ
jgi:hypothetical protein